MAASTMKALSFRLSAQPLRVQRPRMFTAIRAEEEQKTTFFENNRLAGTGYLEEDSAGQQNIFAVQPTKYVQGSAMDETTGTAGNTVFGVAGAALGLVVIATGATALLSISTGGDAVKTFEGDVSQLSTLSEYKTQFVSDLRRRSSEATQTEM